MSIRASYHAGALLQHLPQSLGRVLNMRRSSLVFTVFLLILTEFIRRALIYRRDVQFRRQVDFRISILSQWIILRSRKLRRSFHRRGHRRLDHVTAAQLDHFPLLRLPGELRNFIYHFALAANGDHRIEAFVYEARPSALSHLAFGLLGVSRRVRAETMLIFYANNSFITSSRLPFTRRLSNCMVHQIPSLTLRADLSLLWKYRSLETALKTEVLRLQNLVHLGIRLEKFMGMYGEFDLHHSIIECVRGMKHLKSLALEGVQEAGATTQLVDSIKAGLEDTDLEREGRDPANLTMVIVPKEGSLRCKAA
ncbi:hypothetical protein MMC16_001990 [Acarospora aff. strigata]|nr:hypothetical protein [Acarospora aff. strigata]